MMQINEHRFVSAEFKFVGDGEPGVFDGYGAVFNNVDSHGDLILPGAFAKTLAEHKSRNRLPPMFIEHGPYLGGDRLPAGKYLEMSEDNRGLHVKGKLSALDTEHGRRIHGLMMDGVLGGLSIAFKVPPGGAVYGKRANEPTRTLKELKMLSVDIVNEPSNSEANILNIKSVLAMGGVDTAARAVAAAIGVHHSTMNGGDAPTAEERQTLMAHLQEAHKALTGQEYAGMKSAPKTTREFEAMLREEFGFSNTQARAIAEFGFKSSQPREEGGEAATETKKAALSEIGAALTGFSLPTF